MDPQLTNQKRAILVVGSLIGIVAVTLGVAVVVQDDDDAETTSTSTVLDTTTTALPTSTTAPPTTSSTIDADELDLAVYPDLRGPDRFDDPVALVRAFATEILGFDTDLIVGSLQVGDSRSGEIEVSPRTGGPATTVAVRQLADGAWAVVAATTETIFVQTPIARTRISSPQPLIGKAAAFEGHVNVSLFVDGQLAPLADTFVLGRGDGVLGDFEGSLTFVAPEGATHGLLVFSEGSAEDGTTVAATALRVKL